LLCERFLNLYNFDNILYKDFINVLLRVMSKFFDFLCVLEQKFYKTLISKHLHILAASPVTTHTHLLVSLSPFFWLQMLELLDASGLPGGSSILLSL